MPTKPFNDPEIDQLRASVISRSRNLRAAVWWLSLLVGVASVGYLAWQVL